jgi:peptidoglycan hydrolase CwlO-like protein
MLRTLAVGSAVLVVGCGNPRAEAATAQALNDAANEISGLRNDVGQLQTQIDSLREIVAKQDSAIARITAQMPK